MHLNSGFLKFQLGNQVRELEKKNQNNTDITQICFETFDSFKVCYVLELRIFKNPIKKLI